MKDDQHSLLFELSRAFSAQIDLDELLPLINAKTREVLDAESCAILLLDEEKGELYFPVTSEQNPELESRFKEIRFPADRGVAGWVLRCGEPALVEDAQHDERFYGEVDRQSGVHTRDLLYAPLRSRRGVLGVVGLRNKQKGRFTGEDLAFLDALAGSIAIAIDNARLYARLKDSEERLRAEVGALRRDIARRDSFAEIIGAGSAMAEVFRLMESAAACQIAVLIEGETGTGKELVARAIHRESERGSEAFLGVNCAALSETLLESELFGHRRGAFTGAVRDKRGLFEAATRGTIFLDEVGETSPAMQAKLLRVLQESEVTPVGDTRPRAIDVRVIAATNRDLVADVTAHAFREDLYYRLAAFPIHLPPLRERPEDISLMVARFIGSASTRQRKRIRGIAAAAMDLMTSYRWPGNVRELENEVERAVALAADAETIGAGHLSAKLRVSAPPATGSEPAPAGASEPVPISASLRQGRAAFEARYIAQVLKEHGGVITRAAQALGMSRVTLYKKLREYGFR